MPNIVVRIAETFKSFGASTVYGPPVELDGGAVLPVAFEQYGFGGGGAGETEGGGGGGGIAIPVGIYRQNDAGKPVFRANTLTLLIAAAPLVWTSGRAVALILKAARR